MTDPNEFKKLIDLTTHLREVQTWHKFVLKNDIEKVTEMIDKSANVEKWCKRHLTGPWECFSMVVYVKEERDFLLLQLAWA